MWGGKCEENTIKNTLYEIPKELIKARGFSSLPSPVMRCDCLEVEEPLAAPNDFRLTCKLGYKILDCQRNQGGMREDYKTGREALVTCGRCRKIYFELEFQGKKNLKSNVMLASLWTAFTPEYKCFPWET